MKYEELNRRIKSYNIPKIFFFYGDEKFLLENRVKALKKRIVPEDLEAFNFLALEGKGVGLSQIIEAAEQYPQAADRKMITVKNSGLFDNAASKDFKGFKAYTENLPDYVCLVFIEDEFDKKRENILKFIEDAGGGVVCFEYLPVNKLEVWAEKKLEKAGKQIIAADLSYLIRRTGVSMSSVNSACERLISYLGETRHKITREDINSMVSVSVEAKVYDIFSKDIVNSRGERAKRQLKQLKVENQSASMVMSIIIDQLYELLLVKLLKQDGLQAREMLEYYDRKPPIFAVNNAIENSKKFGEKYLKRMLDRGLKYSIDMKSGKIAQWDAVEMFVSELIKRD